MCFVSYINCTARRRYFSYTIQLEEYYMCFVVIKGGTIEHRTLSGENGRTLTPVTGHHFERYAIAFTSYCQRLLEGTPKDVYPVYLESMPGEVKDRT